jgi:outer membrane protein TolC
VSAQGVGTVYDDEVTALLGPGQEVVIRPQFDFRISGTVSQRLDGRVLPQLDSALKAESLARLSEAELGMELSHLVTQLYFQLLTMERIVEINRNSLESREVLLKAAEGRLEAGAGTSFEVTRAKTEVKRARGDVERSRLAFINTRLELAKILMTEADFSIAHPNEPAVPATFEEGMAQAMSGRPDLKRAKLDLSLAENEIDTLYWTYVPTLLTQFQVVQQQETAFNPQSLSWQVQLILSWSLYDGGLREAQITEAKSVLRERRIQEEKVQKAVETELLQAFETLRSQEI